MTPWTVSGQAGTDAPPAMADLDEHTATWMRPCHDVFGRAYHMTITATRAPVRGIWRNGAAGRVHAWRRPELVRA